jgi:hypothetical protein
MSGKLRNMVVPLFKVRQIDRDVKKKDRRKKEGLFNNLILC